MIYIMDTNVYIHTKNYEFDFEETPAFWTLILRLTENRSLAVPVKVYEEIMRGKDQLSVWFEENRPSLFLLPDANAFPHIGQVADTYVSTGNGITSDVFLDSCGADPWIIAHALACGGTVVTFERGAMPSRTTSTQNPKKKRIPEICQQLGVDTMSFAKFLWVHLSPEATLPHEEA